MNEQMRKDFEAWAVLPEHQLAIARHPAAHPAYADYTTAWAWEAWQACAAALSQPAAAEPIVRVGLVDRRNDGMKAHWIYPAPDLEHGTELFIAKATP